MDVVYAVFAQDQMDQAISFKRRKRFLSLLHFEDSANK